MYICIKHKRVRHYCIKKIAKLENGYAYSLTVRELYKKYYGISIGYGTYGGCFDVAQISYGTSFGNWCSIATNLTILRYDHPMNDFTMHPILYDPIMKFVNSFGLNKNDLEVGNDVWMGKDVLILPKCHKIGNGAVIGAGSVVTKDVDPYTVVAGNPAKVIKRRFSEDIINKLESSKWWEKEFNELTQNIEQLQDLVKNENNTI